MIPKQHAVWEFFGFESVNEGCPVQRWYDGLGIDAQDEITNLVEHLRVMPGGPKERRDFDPLEGAGGVSELRPIDVRTARGNYTYRIYGRLGYPTKHSYTFLHGTDKDMKNDEAGKS